VRWIAIWDAPTRLFHWFTATLVAAAYVTWRFNWMDWHIRVGYALLALILFRLLWGLFGSETARFSRFLVSPGAAARYLTHLFRREPDRQVGHNPSGGWMVLLLLLLLFAEALTGLYVNNDVANAGPLTEHVPATVANLITDLHALLWQLLLAAATLHILVVVIVYGAVKRQNLVLPMITGRKALPTGTRPPVMAGIGRGLLLFGCALLVTAALVKFL